MTHVSLFTGIGGLDLAAEAAGFETVLQVEREPFPLQVLEKHWPNVPRITDVREVHNDERWRNTTVISGGFPCQPFSKASHGRKTAEDLSGEFVRVVQELRPKYAIGENVSDGIIGAVCAQLRDIGYRATTEHSRAFDYGASHLRHRWWAVAYPNDEGQFLSILHAKMAELRQIQDDMWAAKNYARVIRVHDGLSGRVDRNRTARLKALGNAVVPAQASPIFAAIAEAENNRHTHKTMI